MLEPKSKLYVKIKEKKRKRKISFIIFPPFPNKSSIIICWVSFQKKFQTFWKKISDFSFFSLILFFIMCYSGNFRKKRYRKFLFLTIFKNLRLILGSFKRPFLNFSLQISYNLKMFSVRTGPCRLVDEPVPAQVRACRCLSLPFGAWACRSRLKIARNAVNDSVNISDRNH